jgi:hypothetical protein
MSRQRSLSQKQFHWLKIHSEPFLHQASSPARMPQRRATEEHESKIKIEYAKTMPSMNVWDRTISSVVAGQGESSTASCNSTLQHETSTLLTSTVSNAGDPQLQCALTTVALLNKLNPRNFNALSMYTLHSTETCFNHSKLSELCLFFLGHYLN